MEAKVAVCSATDPWGSPGASIRLSVCCPLLSVRLSVSSFTLHLSLALLCSSTLELRLPPLLRLSQFRDSSLWSHISFALLTLKLTSHKFVDFGCVGCLKAVLSSLQSFLWPEIRSIPPSGDCTVRQGRSFPYCELNRCLVIALYLCGLAVYYCLNLSSGVLAGASMSLNNCLFLWCCQHIVFLNRQWKEIVRTEQNKETRKTAHYLGGIIHSRGKRWEQIHVEIFNINSFYFIWTFFQKIQFISLKNISLKQYNSVLLDFYIRLSVIKLFPCRAYSLAGLDAWQSPWRHISPII